MADTLVEQNACSQFPEAPGCHEEGHDGVAAQGPYGIADRGQRADGEQANGELAPSAVYQPGDEQQREHEIELFLDRQRPGVGIGVVLGGRCKIVAPRLREDEVAQAEECVEAGLLVDGAEPGRRNEQGTEQGSDQQADDQRGKYAGNTAAIEVTEELPQAPAFETSDRGTDNEAGDDEKYVHTDETAR